ncbi:unnamed protein product [Scytosiphon promiscuus]
MFRRRAAAAQQGAAGTPSCCARENSFGATSSGLRAPVCRFNHLRRQRGRLNVRKTGLHSSDENVQSRRLFGGAARATSSTSATQDDDHRQRQQQERLHEGAMRRHAVTAADFVGVMRALLWMSPPSRHVASAAPSEAAAGMTETVRIAEVDATETPQVVAAAKQARDSDSSQVLGARNQERRWEPRTSLDLSGHAFGEVLQAGIDRSKYRQREAAKFEPGDSETASNATLAAQQQEDQQREPEEPKNVVSRKEFSGSSCTLSGEMTNTVATADHAAPEGQANIPRGDKNSWWKNNHGDGGGAPSEVGGSDWSSPTLRGSSSTSTLPPSPLTSVGGGSDGADVAAADATKGRPELPPLVPGTRSRNYVKSASTATSSKRCVRRRQRQQHHQQCQQQY